MSEATSFPNLEPDHHPPDALPQEGFAILDFEWKYLYVNDAAARQRHLAPQDMLGRYVQDIFPETLESPAYLKGLIVLRERVSQRVTLAFPGPGGAPTWLDLVLEPIAEGMLVRSREIPAPLESEDLSGPGPAPCDHAEACLHVKASEARYRSVFQGMSEGFALQEIILGPGGEPCDSRFLDVNKAFERLTGFTHGGVVGRASADCVPPSPLWGAAFGPVARTGRSRHEEAYWPHAGKHFEIFSYSPAPGQFAVLFMDITDRRKAEEKNRQQAAVLEAINEIFHEAMVRETQEEVAGRCLEVVCRLTSTPYGVVLATNAQGGLDALGAYHASWKSTGIARGKALARMRNLTPEGSLGKAFRDRRTFAGPAGADLPDHPVPLDGVLAVPLAQGESCLGLIVLANKAEDFTPWDRELLETLARALVEALSRKRSELAVQELNSHLEARGVEMQAALEELDAFSYSVSHDLRAPLRHIIGFAELLQHSLQGKLEEKPAHYLDTILASSRHMGHLIDVLLTFSQTGRGVLTRRKVDLGALVKDIIAGMEPEYRNRRVAWEVAPLPVVSADPVLLRSVLVNLLSNALKFTRNRPEARIRIASETLGRETIVAVADNGAGFDPRHADKLFGVFQRLHPAAQFEGAGVGLANVRRIILRHGGRVWATGAVDEGATFHFTLPAPRERSAP